ncbi:MAG: LON peptidase substrate-binding domain-containing protein, partial [Novipirellula sp. JB048]
MRLFPLPELVMFPHAMQPLHLFEPRYCELLRESLASDRLIAMATLTGGISTLADGAPPIATTVCIGRIVSHAELENDRHNILLVGVKRATITREIDAGRSFRIAEVEVHSDLYPPIGAESRRQLKQELLEAFATVIPSSKQASQSLHELMAGQMGLGPITDIIAYTLPFEIESKLRLLAIADVDDRAAELVRLLRSGKINLHSVSAEEQNGDPAAGGDSRFPPPFSANCTPPSPRLEPSVPSCRAAP